MSKLIADQNAVGFQYESGTYNTATGASLQWIGQVSEHNITTNKNITQRRYLGTNDRSVSTQIEGALQHEGTFTYNPQDWKYLGFALGSNVDTGSNATTVPYTHTVSEVNSDDKYAFTSGAECPFASFTIEDSQKSQTTGSNFVRTVKGAIVDSFNLNWSEGEDITCTVDYKAQSVDFSSGAPTSLTAATTRPFAWRDIKVHIPSGTVFTEINSGDFTVNNNLLVRNYSDGSDDPVAPIPLGRDYTLELGLDATSQRTKTLYDQYFRGGSEFNVLLEVTAADAGTGSRSLFLSLSGCVLTDMDSPSNNEGVNEQAITIVPANASAVVNDLIALYNPY